MSKQNKTLIITPGKPGIVSYLKEVLNSRELIGAFYRRDLKVRYAQTFVGVFWVIIQPLLYLLAFLLAFGTLLGDSSQQVPYLLFPVTGLLVWTYFSFCTQQAGSSLIRSQEIIRKSYFPRVILPLSKSLVGLIDVLVTLGILVFALVLFKLDFQWQSLFTIGFLLASLCFSVGMGLIISVLSVRYRDVQHLIPIMTHVLLFVSPIAYPSSIVIERLPQSLSWLYYLNPLAGLIDGIRWSVFNEIPSVSGVLIGICLSIGILGLGLTLYSRNDAQLADEL